MKETDIAEAVLAGGKLLRCVVCGGPIPFTQSNTRGIPWPKWNYVHERPFRACDDAWDRTRYSAKERANDAAQEAVRSGSAFWIVPTEKMLKKARG